MMSARSLGAAVLFNTGDGLDHVWKIATRESWRCWRLVSGFTDEYLLHCLHIYCSRGMLSLSWPKWALYQNVASGSMVHPLIWNVHSKSNMNPRLFSSRYTIWWMAPTGSFVAVRRIPSSSTAVLVFGRYIILEWWSKFVYVSSFLNNVKIYYS